MIKPSLPKLVDEVSGNNATIFSSLKPLPLTSVFEEWNDPNQYRKMSVRKTFMLLREVSKYLWLKSKGSMLHRKEPESNCDGVNRITVFVTTYDVVNHTALLY